MAQRVKTIEYAFQSYNSSLASATRYDFSAITLYIPETTSRTFRSVIVEVTCRDTATSATSLTAPLVGVKLGAAAFGDTTLGDPPGNTGESGQYIFLRDATAYFVTNFGSGASQTCQVGVQFTGPATINHSAKLYITYEYDDSAGTQVKTVRIPLESGTDALTTTLTEIGTNQIPALDTFLPEASKTYRNIWFELTYNEFTLGPTNDAQLGMQVDSGSENLSGAHESGLGSSCAGKYLWDQGASPAWATNAVHAFKLRSSNITAASTFNHVGILLCVTYEYSPADSTTIINSLVLGMAPITSAGQTASTDALGEQVEFWIEEPATVTLVQSGALVFYSQVTWVNPAVSFGTQSYRTYTDANMAYCGVSCFTQRIDSGSAAGSALTPARGKNVLRTRIYTSTGGSPHPAALQGLVYLNYTSGKSSQGVGAHNQTTAWTVQESQASATVGNIAAAQWINVPETAWFRSDLTAVVQNVMGAANTPVCNITVEAEAASGELTEEFVHLAGTFGQTDVELGWYPAITPEDWFDPRTWDRWASDPETSRMDIEGSRRMRVTSWPVGTRALFLLLTKHSISFTVSGTVSGSGGGTVYLKVCRASDGVKLAETSRVGNGAYSVTVYDNVNNVYVEAYEGASYLGRSDNGTATGSA
jgi:hypothetical protein